MVEAFNDANQGAKYPVGLNGFKQWIYDEVKRSGQKRDQPAWEGKESGRSPESFISTLVVRMNRYAKMYAKAAIHDSDFSTQEEFIYLINLNALGPMTKMELIRRNIHDKPAGIQILNRLQLQGWVEQGGSHADKRRRIIRITAKGQAVLQRQMVKIRQATRIVTGNLDHDEKTDLIRLLSKLDDFHHDIFIRNLPASDLLDVVTKDCLPPIE
ncbi:MarR family winged helix-turn-helix transcriptional regulator [Chitinophaga rhizosphaerae]|uniref:MarR family winged helix-turn-helix transcriptional regulator n=1 Tax=Chitinophaga rhizosphaerae TaxID=1864947 RepID=UPI00196B9BBA|nr:MarR family winged helix-turn-helix transcriptional regulator [Chitinophaga rhizosphaerae]